jgi:class 3 adenylate cyclase
MPQPSVSLPALPRRGDARTSALVWLGVLTRVWLVALALLVQMRASSAVESSWVWWSIMVACAVSPAAIFELLWQRHGSRTHERRQRLLERFLPRALRETVAAGHELPHGVYELSVLFVDLRGYSSFAEQRRPEEIFATISCYVRRASRIIERSGGAVVEFSGDGLMALFGCPTALADKEEAAVRAALELIRAFPFVAANERDLWAREVGVGIATGSMHVGTIGWRDRAVWSATGNATILAARLQAATRSLEASVAIDAVTYQRAGSARSSFRKIAGFAIRGHKKRQDVFIVDRQAPLETVRQQPRAAARKLSSSRMRRRGAA